MNTFARKNVFSLGYAAEVNYYLALAVSMGVAVMSLSGNLSLFEFNDEILNPLINNLKLMLVYLALAELSIFVYCTLMQSYKELTFVGLFLLLMSGALEFYGQVNQLVIDQNFHWFFLYLGASHILYGILAVARNERTK